MYFCHPSIKSYLSLLSMSKWFIFFDYYCLYVLKYQACNQTGLFFY